MSGKNPADDILINASGPVRPCFVKGTVAPDEMHSIMVRASGSYGRLLIGVVSPVINLAPGTGAWIIGAGVKPPV